LASRFSVSYQSRRARFRFFIAGHAEVNGCCFQPGMAHPFLDGRQGYALGDAGNGKPMPQPFGEAIAPVIPARVIAPLTMRYAVGRENVRFGRPESPS